jgi:hypothetical protein
MTGGETVFLVVSLAAFGLFAVVIAWANKRTRTR